VIVVETLIRDLNTRALLHEPMRVYFCTLKSQFGRETQGV